MVRIKRNHQVRECFSHGLRAEVRRAGHHLQLHARVARVHAALRGGHGFGHGPHGNGGAGRHGHGVGALGRLPADKLPQRLFDDLAVQVPQRRLKRAAPHGQLVCARTRREQAIGLGRMQQHRAEHQRNQLLTQNANILVKHLGQVPVGWERHAFAQARAPGVVHHFHQQRLAERQRALRRGERFAERQANAV